MDEPEMISVPKDVMAAVIEILDIASDWGAPSHYDIVPPKGWEDTHDPGSDEPDWVALYKFTAKLHTLI